MAKSNVCYLFSDQQQHREWDLTIPWPKRIILNAPVCCMGSLQLPAVSHLARGEDSPNDET
jgi:hypothetical protein